MARLYLANAIIPCISSFLVDQVKAHLTSSAEESAESIKELTPDEPETTLASRNRLQDLPEWFQEFTENVVEPKSTSSRTTTSRSSTSQGIKRENTICLRMFPRIHIVKYASVRKLRGQLADDIHEVTYLARPSSEKLLQPITKSFNEEEQPRNNQRYATVVQDLAIHGFKAARVKREETATMFTKVSRSQNPSFLTPTTYFNSDKLVKILNGTSRRLLLFSRRQMELQKKKNSEKSQRRHFVCFMLTGACWTRANSWLEQLVSRDERASTTHLGNPPPRRLVDDSGQGTGDAGRITVACEHQFKQHCKAVDAVDTLLKSRRNHLEPGQLGCVCQTVRDSGHVWEFLMGIVVSSTLDHRCASTLKRFECSVQLHFDVCEELNIYRH